MPSSFTSVLGLEKPATGEQNQTWGITIDANMDKIDAALASVAGSFASASSALTTEASIRQTIDNQTVGMLSTETTSRTAAVANLQTQITAQPAQWQNADLAALTFVNANYMTRTATGQNTNVYFTPGDGFDVPVRLYLQVAEGGYVIMTSSVVVSYQVPNTLLLRQYINSVKVTEAASLSSQPASFVQRVDPNTTVALEAHVVTTSGGGWCPMLLSLSCLFVPT